MSSKAGKRPLRSLTAHEKLEAIRRVHDGESKASVARDIGVPESTLRGWCKNEDKISYLSRQSSPETEDSLTGESKEKKPKLDEPYNLSKKASEDFDNKPLNLKQEGFKSPTSERERNRAELARLSVELGLNRPEMFLPNSNSLSDLANMNLLTQWNLLMQQKTGKVTAPADTSTSYPTKPTKPPKSTLDESVWYWLKTQPSTGLLQPQNGLPPVTSTSNTPAVTSSSNYDTTIDHSSWFWKWYKQFANSYPLPHQTPDKPILYQQLTKDKDAAVNRENLEDKPTTKSNNTKARAVLDNLLFNNNNIAVDKKDVKDEVLNQTEALEHGEKFLEWLECCSEPSVTAVQILQFKSLLNNIKNGADRKNGDLQNKAKVKRK